MTVQQNKLSRVVAAPSGAAGTPLQALAELEKAVKGAGFYPQGHPARALSLQRAFQALQGLLAEQELALAVNRQGFLWGGEFLEGNVMVLQLASDCFIRRITTLTFLPDLLPGDLAALADLLCRDPQQIEAAGGIAAQLQAGGARTVWVNEKDVAAIWAKREAAGSRGEEDTGGDAFAAGLPSELPGEPCAFPDLELLIGETAGAHTVPELLRLMGEENGEARYQELGRELLERVRDDGEKVAMLPVLEEVLRQHLDPRKSLPLRDHALFILERLVDGAADYLIASLESRDFPDKEGVHRVLASLGGKGTYRIIQRLCLAQGVFERKSLARALIAIGTPALPPLVSMLKDERWYVVRNMVSIIGELGMAESAASLRGPLYHGDLRVRKEAVRALLKIAGEPAEGMLIPLLEEPGEALLGQAILSLGLMRSRLAVPCLLKLLERHDLLLKRLALKKELLAALGRIGDPRATGPLLKLLASRGWPVPGRWLELKVAAASALGKLGDEAALPALAGLAAGEGELAEACREALDALERLSGGSYD